jgi:ribosomal protein S27AE
MSTPDLTDLARRALEAFRTKEPLTVTPDEVLVLARSMDVGGGLWDQALIKVIRSDFPEWDFAPGRTVPIVIKQDEPCFVCPRCGARSFNPTDMAKGYCGRCHAYTRG